MNKTLTNYFNIFHQNLKYLNLNLAFTEQFLVIFFSSFAKWF